MGDELCARVSQTAELSPCSCALQLTFSFLCFVCIWSALAADFAFRLWVVFMGFGTPWQVMENPQNVGYKQWPPDGGC